MDRDPVTANSTPIVVQVVRTRLSRRALLRRSSLALAGLAALPAIGLLASCAPAPAAPTPAPATAVPTIPPPPPVPTLAPTSAATQAPASAQATAAPTVAPTRPAATPTPAAAAPKPGGRVIYGTFADAKVINPVLSNDVQSAEVGEKIYESLITLNPKTAAIEPRLAEKFGMSSDNKTMSFTLRDGLKWSDGSAFTGEDFKFTAEAVMRSKKTVRKNIFQDIAGAKDYGAGKAETIAGIKVDGKNITVELEKPYCPAFSAIGGFPIVPKSVYGKYYDAKVAEKNLDDAPENIAPPLAMGPFKFKEWKPNDRLTLVRNDGFWAGKALLDEWVMRVYPDQVALAAALKTAEIDIAAVGPQEVDDLKKLEQLALHSYLAPGYTYIGWNLLRGGKEFLQSKSLRQAFAYGLDMDLVVQKVYFGYGQKMVAHTAPVSWAYDKSQLNEYKYDVKKAQSLIEEQGWKKGSDGIYAKDGQKLEFTIVTNSGNKARETLLQVAVEQYKLIGINATPKTESFEALVDRLTKSKDAKYGDQGGHDFDACIIGWSLSADPDAYSIWHSSQAGGGFNFVSYKNAVVDKALEDGRTKCSTPERRAAYVAMDKQLNDDQPYNFGVASNTNMFVNKKVQGYDPGPFSRYGFWNVEKWWIK